MIYSTYPLGDAMHSVWEMANWLILPKLLFQLRVCLHCAPSSSASVHLIRCHSCGSHLSLECFKIISAKNWLPEKIVSRVTHHGNELSETCQTPRFRFRTCIFESVHMWAALLNTPRRAEICVAHTQLYQIFDRTIYKRLCPLSICLNVNTTTQKDLRNSSFSNRHLSG